MVEKTRLLSNKKLKEIVVTVGVLLLVQIIFMLLDGTGWEPNVRETNFINNVLNAKLFTEYFRFYSYPFFNFVTFLHLAAILICVSAEILSIIFKKNKKSS
ncbi:YfzA family protein [Oceanobacillus sojae]|uniref:YfzA family protein n=1 Tax=Oceanobacillus sojae TaxID=582851 RepID=UPI00098871BC|nr:YfzA family protein [Oceanobacillus sojae]MCT1902604.1 YfzA family protein [Oceanobacillus sojae]